MYTDEETGEKKHGIATVRYTHEAMIDLLIAEPRITQRKLAEVFGMTEGWVSLVVNSDAFRARLEERRAELVDPVILTSVKDRLSAVAARSLELIAEKLNQPLASSMASEDFLLKSAKLSTEALGYGARAANASAQTNVAVVIQVPPKSASAAEWVTNHTPQGV